MWGFVLERSSWLFCTSLILVTFDSLRRSADHSCIRPTCERKQSWLRQRTPPESVVFHLDNEPLLIHDVFIGLWKPQTCWLLSSWWRSAVVLNEIWLQLCFILKVNQIFNVVGFHFLSHFVCSKPTDYVTALRTCCRDSVGESLSPFVLFQIVVSSCFSFRLFVSLRTSVETAVFSCFLVNQVRPAKLWFLIDPSL